TLFPYTTLFRSVYPGELSSKQIKLKLLTIIVEILCITYISYNSLVTKGVVIIRQVMIPRKRSDRVHINIKRIWPVIHTRIVNDYRKMHCGDFFLHNYGLRKLSFDARKLFFCYIPFDRFISIWIDKKCPYSVGLILIFIICKKPFTPDIVLLGHKCEFSIKVCLVIKHIYICFTAWQQLFSLVFMEIFTSADKLAI